MVNYRHGRRGPHYTTEMLSKVRSWWRWGVGRRDHAAGKTQWRAVEQVRRRARRVSSDGRLEAEEDKRQIVHPAGTRGTGTEDETVFQSSVLPLNHPITLRMVGRRLLPRDAQEVS